MSLSLDGKKQAKTRFGKRLKLWQKRFHSPKVKAIFCVIFIFLSVFQKPVWCNRNGEVASNSFIESCSSLPLKDEKTNRDVDSVVHYFIPIIPFYLIEILIILALTVYDTLDLYCFDLKPRRKNFIIGAIILTLILLVNDTLVIV